MTRPRRRIAILLACCGLERCARMTRRQAGAAPALGLAGPARAVEEVRSPRPLAYRILKGDPPLMQPYEQRAAPKLLKSLADGADAVLLGVKRNDPEDYALAADLASKLASAAKRPVAVGLDAMPLGSSLRRRRAGPPSRTRWTSSSPSPSSSSGRAATSCRSACRPRSWAASNGRAASRPCRSSNGTRTSMTSAPSCATRSRRRPLTSGPREW